MVAYISACPLGSNINAFLRLSTWSGNTGINKVTGVKHVEPAKQISIEDIEQNSARDALALEKINQSKKGSE